MNRTQSPLLLVKKASELPCLQDDAHEKLERALLGANLGTYDARLDTGEVVVNDRYLALLGHAPGELQMTTQEWMNRIHPDDLPHVQAHYDHIVNTAEKFVNCEYRLRHRDGHWVWLHDLGTVFESDPSGRPLRIAGTQQDISDRKHAELALQESETRYRTVVESSPVAIMIYVDQRVVMANPACIKIYRASSEQELLGRDVWSLTSPTSHALLRQRIGRALMEGQENPVAEIEILRLDGSALHVDGVSVPVTYQGHKAVHVMMYDATARRQAEAHSRQRADEMEQLLALQVAYQTVASIAHELNQPLNSVSTLAEAAALQLQNIQPLPPDIQDTLDGIAQGAQRAGRVVHELLSFMRQPVLVQAPVQLCELVRKLVSQFRTDMAFAGDIRIELPDTLPRAMGNVLQINKVLHNLLRNAAEACSTGPNRGKKARILIAGDVTGDRVRICVSDNGPGVPPDLLPRLFQPFASSKPGGMGMGLAISQSLARLQGGTLSHEATAGKGARFCLTLPTCADNHDGAC